jgi:hypothetical protein
MERTLFVPDEIIHFYFSIYVELLDEEESLEPLHVGEPYNISDDGYNITLSGPPDLLDEWIDYLVDQFKMCHKILNE